MKAEINQRIAALLENPEIEAVRVEVRTAFEVYKDAREKDVATQRAAFDEEEHPAPEPGEEPIRFSYQPDEEDARNDEMYKAFRELLVCLARAWTDVEPGLHVAPGQQLLLLEVCNGTQLFGLGDEVLFLLQVDLEVMVLQLLVDVDIVEEQQTEE